MVVLGHDFWEKQLGADRSIIGRKVRLNGIEFTVIGVAPERFTGMDQYFRPALYLPLMMAPRLAANPEHNLLERRDDRELTVKGRLQPGTSMAQAQAELAGIAKGLEQAYPATNRDQGVAVRTELQSRIERRPRDAALVAMLMALAALVLLVACANRGQPAAQPRAGPLARDCHTAGGRSGAASANPATVGREPGDRAGRRRW